jgi:hypothetical protein
MAHLVQRGLVLCLRIRLYSCENGSQCCYDSAGILSDQCIIILAKQKIPLTTPSCLDTTIFIYTLNYLPDIPLQTNDTSPAKQVFAHGYCNLDYSHRISPSFLPQRKFLVLGICMCSNHLNWLSNYD